jgi:type II secretory pathway pseudopilin PulG
MPRYAARTIAGSRAAFSLLEAVLVVAVLGVLAAIAAPRYGQAIARYRVESAARRIVADLDLARRSARTTGVRRTVRFSVPDSGYTIAGLRGLKGTSPDYHVPLADPPYEARIVSVDFGGDAELVFDGFGQADSDGEITVQTGDTRRTVAFQAGSGKAAVR